MRKPKLPDHEGCYIFETDFDTRKIIYEHIGRLYVGNGHCVRIVFGLTGLKLVIPHEAVEDGSVLINDPKLEDQIEFVGLKDAKFNK